MSDELAPQASPRRVLRRVAVISLAVVLLLTLAGVLVGIPWWDARSYEKEFDQWNSSEKPKMVAATRAVPHKAFGYQYVNTKKDITAQKVGCDRVALNTEKISAAAGKLPQPTSRLLAGLVPSHNRAQSRAKDRSATVDAFAQRATKVFGQMTRDCRWSAQVIREWVDITPLYDKADKLTDPKGTTGGGYVCEEEIGCLPDDAKRLKKYVDLRARALRREEVVAALFDDRSCTQTSFGDLCSVVGKLHDRPLDADRAYLGAVRRDESAAAIAVVADRADRAWTRFQRDMKATLIERFPDLKGVETFTETPTEPDAFFFSVAFMSVDELGEHVAPVEAL